MRIEEIFTEAFDNNAYYKSFNGRIKKMYEKARTRTPTKGYPTLIDSQEFYELAAKDRTYKKLFKQWEESDFDIRMTPTLDRVNAKKGYIAGNLQFLTYTDNVVKGNKEYDKRPYEARRQAITMTKGRMTKKFKSMTDVAAFFSVHPSTITRNMSNKQEIDGWKLTT